MYIKTIETLERIAAERLPKDDPSHDFSHAWRVLSNARQLAAAEHGEMEILLPSALFHDLVNPSKLSPMARQGPELSAIEAGRILRELSDYPQTLILRVEQCIRECSFTNGIRPTSVESSILQDADLLESVGAVAIMRTFASSGKLQRAFYHPTDPFCTARPPEPLVYAVDVFFSRLLVAVKRLNTATAKEMVKSRERFLQAFLVQLGVEISQTYQEG